MAGSTETLGSTSSEADEVVRRLRENFVAGHLTQVSIVQGVALAFLLANTFTYVNSASYLSEWARYMPYSVLTFLCIVMTSYNYTVFMSAYRWTPTLLDVFVPLFVGVWEIAPTFYLTTPAVWWMLVGIASLVGAGAMLYTDRRAREDPLWTTRAHVAKTTLAFAGIVFIALSVAVRTWPASVVGPYTWPEMIASALFICGWVLVLGFERRFLANSQRN